MYRKRALEFDFLRIVLKLCQNLGFVERGKCVVFSISDLPTCSFSQVFTIGPIQREYQHKSFKLLQFLLTLGHKVEDEAIWFLT